MYWHYINSFTYYHALRLSYHYCFLTLATSQITYWLAGHCHSQLLAIATLADIMSWISTAIDIEYIIDTIDIDVLNSWRLSLLDIIDIAD